MLTSLYSFISSSTTTKKQQLYRYRTSDQVTSVLWSLEKEYRREEDWCQNEKAINSGDPTSYLAQLSSKHAEQKEAFLKACMLAR